MMIVFAANLLLLYSTLRTVPVVKLHMSLVKKSIWSPLWMMWLPLVYMALVAFLILLGVLISHFFHDYHCLWCFVDVVCCLLLFWAFILCVFVVLQQLFHCSYAYFVPFKVKIILILYTFTANNYITMI